MAADRDLWRRACATEVPEDETERFLDLAAYADGLLETEEAARVAAMVASDAAAAADVASAQSRTPGAGIPERIVERALQLVPPRAEPAEIIAFPQRGWARRLVYGTAQWGGLAAAIALAGWLGFSMGSDTSLALSQPVQAGEDAALPDLLDPATGFIHELTQDLRT
jgi:anti-sigma factor RsiW